MFQTFVSFSCILNYVSFQNHFKRNLIESHKNFTNTVWRGLEIRLFESTFYLQLNRRSPRSMISRNHGCIANSRECVAQSSAYKLKLRVGDKSVMPFCLVYDYEVRSCLRNKITRQAPLQAGNQDGEPSIRSNSGTRQKRSYWW